MNFIHAQKLLVVAFSFTSAELACSSSIETLVSTIETPPYVDCVPQDFDVHSNLSTIYLSSDFEDETELLTHHVNDNRPPAPYDVISETRLDNNGETFANQAQSDLVILS